MHLPGSSNFEPAACQGASLELDIDLRAGLGERKKAGSKAQHQIVRLEKSAAKIGENKLQVLEAHVLANPQAFALMEHRRMGSVTVNAVGATRCNDTNLGHGASGINQCTVFFDMLDGIADLHRAGMGAQQIRRSFGAAFNIKRIVHGARWMVFRRVERREIKPIGFDLRALRHIKTHRAEGGFDSLQRERYRMQTALHTLAAGQADVQRLGFELLVKLSIG